MKIGKLNDLARVGLLVCGCCFFLAAAAIGNGPAEENVFRAGVSLSDVTPPLGLAIVGNFGDPPSAEHIHDPLFAKTLILDDGHERVVFILVDNIGLPAWICEAAKDTINRETKIPTSHILIAAIHTHSSVSAVGQGDLRRGYNYGLPFDDYQEFLIRRIADGVRVAINNLQPAQIGWGSFDKPQHVFNRRWYMKEQVVNPFGFLDSVKMNPGFSNPEDLLRPAGPTDPEVSFIAVKSLSDQPIAILANYSLHYVGGVPKHDISADYFGVFARRMEALLGADKQETPFVAIMSNGTSGDINNINFAGEKEHLGAYKKMKFVADDLAQGVLEAYKKVVFHKGVPLRATSSTLLLDVRKPSEELMHNLERINAHEDKEPLFHRLEKTYSDRLAAFATTYPDSIAVTIQAFAIGDLAISAIPFEVFAETGLELKTKIPNKTFTVGIANGSWGYLPTPHQHLLGGYETWLTTNKVQKDATELIVDELLKLHRSLR